MMMTCDLRKAHAHDLDRIEDLDSVIAGVADNILARLEVPPGSRRADSGSPPPVVEIRVPPGFPQLLLVVERGAHPAPVVRVDELPGALPLEVRVVQLVVAIQDAQILRQLLGRGELVYVDVRPPWGTHLVILRPGPHHDGQNPSVQRIYEELLCDVVLAVGVLERQVELVVVVQDLKALVRRAPRALEVATSPIDVNLLAKLLELSK